MSGANEFAEFEDRKDSQNQNPVQIPCTINHEWIAAKTRGRWAPFWNGRTFNPPPSEARKKARAKKLAFAGDRELARILPLCMTGDELLAERAHVTGDGTSFESPRTDDARELVALLPHKRLRSNETMLLVALAYAMLERGRPGLVATIDELGRFVRLGKTATGEAMARLIALGFVHTRETYTPYGKCWSQRGNLWQLTTQAIDAYRLLVPHGLELPSGVVDQARLQRRRKACGTASATRAGACASAGATLRNPEAIPDSVSTRENNSAPFRNGDRTARLSTGLGRGTGAVLPETRQAETCSTSGRLRTEQGSRSAADVVAELAELVSDPVARAAILAAAARRKGGAS